MSLNVNNYHYTNAPITEYTEEYLKKHFKECGYVIKRFGCEASIMQRMNRVNIFFIVNALLEKDNEEVNLIDIDNYSTFEEINDKFMDEIKTIFANYTKQAIEDNKHYVLASQNKETSAKPESDQQATKDTTTNKKKKHQIEFYLSCKSLNIIEYMLNEDKIALWTRNLFKKTDNGIVYYGDIYLNKCKSTERVIKCRMQFEPLQLNSDTYIEFIEDSYGTTVQFTYDKFDAQNILCIENMIFERVFLPMSCCFCFQVVRKTQLEP